MTRALKQAGKDGITVQDLAKKLRAKYTNVSVWLHSTGKKKVQKLAPGKYAWKE